MNIPANLQDFAFWLNPINLGCFKKIELIQISYRLLKSKVPELPAKLQKKIGEDLDESPRSLGDFALRIYFLQMMTSNEFSIDLRRSQFLYDSNWLFKGNRFGFKFSTQINAALNQTYRSFYETTGEELTPYLEKMQLLDPKWNPETKKKLETIFTKHFKQADTKEQEFKVQNLMNSFKEIFTFIKTNGGQVPSEFSMLGIYLTSLYMTLEKTGHAFDVKAAYMNAKRVCEELGLSTHSSTQ